jgi:hypothetical protein
MIKLKETPEQVEMAKAIGSKDPAVSRPAAEAFAAAIGPVIQEVLNHAGTSPLIYNDYAFNEDDNQSIPLDLFYNEAVDYIKIWSASPIAGGLPTSEIAGVAEMKFSTYELEGEVSFLKKYARKHYLNVLSAAVERLTNETLVKQELQAWAVLLKALGEAASTTTNSTTTSKHTIAAGVAGVFKLDDLNRLLTLSKRINHSYANGTPTAPFSRGVTDLFVSAEIKEDIRAFAYNPMNTTAVPNTDESTALGLPDQVRQEIYRNVGTSSLYDVNITDLNELGVNQIYNQLFALYASGNIAPGTTTFVPATHELLFGADLSKRNAALRPVAVDAYVGSSVNVNVDDQWRVREDKQGFWLKLKEGRLVLDSRAFLGIVV